MLRLGLQVAVAFILAVVFGRALKAFIWPRTDVPDKSSFVTTSVHDLGKRAG